MMMSDRQQIGVSDLVKQAEISLDSLNRDCTDSDLRQFANLCDDTWELTALDIGLSDSQITAIKEDNGRAEVRRTKFLLKWKETTLRHTYRTLVDAFLKREKTQQALTICKAVKALSHSTTGDVSSQPRVIDPRERNNTPSHASSIKSETNSTSKNIKNRIHALEIMFSRVQIQFMNGPSVTLKGLKSCLATLSSYKSETPTPLLEAKDVNEFFHRLKDYCNAQDPKILEDLIEVLGDEETKKKLSQFAEESTVFRCETKLKDMIGNYDGPENIPPKYKELEIKLGDNWRDKTLEDLREAKSNISLRLWLLKYINEGSLIVTYMVPNSEDLQLDAEQRAYLCRQNVIEITVGGKYAFKNEGNENTT